MNGKTKQDIDPQSELRDEDEEATLPEIEEEPDPARAGPLAAGHAAISRYAKNAPSGPGVYRMSMPRATCSMSARPRASRSASAPMRGRRRTTRGSPG